MKRFVLPILIATLCLLLGLLTLNANTAERETQIDRFVSELKGDCYLCGNDGVTETPLYWGEDNIGIINLNTFHVLHLEINQYDDCGQRIEEPAGYMQSCHLSDEDSRVHAYIFPDNGYAHVQLSGVQYKIDRTPIESNLCQRCIDCINDYDFACVALAEYAIISFSDRMIRPLAACYTLFSMANFEISCDFKENGTVNLQIKYCSNHIN